MAQGSEKAAWRWHLAVALPLLSVFLHAQAASGLLGKAAPDFVLKSIDGENLRLSEYRGEVVLINFWTASCGRCRKQLPRIQSLLNRYPHGLSVLSVSLDRDAGRTRALASDLKLQFPILLDRGKRVARAYDPGRLPLTLVVDQVGTVRFVHEGYREDDADAYATEIQTVLDEQIAPL